VVVEAPDQFGADLLNVLVHVRGVALQSTGRRQVIDVGCPICREAVVAAQEEALRQSKPARERIFHTATEEVAVIRVSRNHEIESREADGRIRKASEAAFRPATRSVGQQVRRNEIAQRRYRYKHP
jgi:hypothetical protein